MTLLKLNNVSRSFGGLSAVSDINIEIEENQLVGIIGPNGAGKTTLFNLLTGVYKPSKGTIELLIDGKMKQIQGKNPHEITALGLARTFQNIRLFKGMPVLNNVKAAMHKENKAGLVSTLLRTSRFYDEEKRIEEEALELLKLVGLEEEKDELASNLPYGKQRRLEIARALATHPKILFLDEPAAGMNPHETEELTALIHLIKEKFHLTIILIEHDMSLVMRLCEKIFVLDYGSCIAQGIPEEIRSNPKVIKAYLGEDE